MTGAEPEPAQGWQFVRVEKWRILAISLSMIVPCFWQRHIEAGDLGSHVYNAWLAQLIEKGQAPGLYFVRQWDNVLVDWLLLHATNALGIVAGEKIVVSICVLIFFWGVFAFVAAASERPPWFLFPCIAMLAYGYSFEMGFLNYYLSIGLAAFSLALLWKGRGVERIAGICVLPLVVLAHPLGFVWLAATVLYLLLWAKTPGWWKLAVPLGVMAVMVALRVYLERQSRFPVDWVHAPFYLLNGADQLSLFSQRYDVLEGAAIAFGVLCVAAEVAARRRDLGFWQSLRLPAELYAIAVFSTALLPENLRPSLDGGWIGLLVSRLTTITAIFGLCFLGCLRPRKWHLLGFGTCSLVFFAFLYRDTLTLNRMESRVESLVSTLSPGTRVLSTIWAPPESRITFMSHFVDRTCIGHCFSYANYEPASRQFRIRVEPGSPVVAASDNDAEDMQAGEYEVQDEDLPMMEIFQCDDNDLTKLCIRELTSGELNGRLGYKPPPK
jgi:hypothetical protein